MTDVEETALCVCGHDALDHGQERFLYVSDSHREVCLNCPGYLSADESTIAYPHGEAWHRFKAVEKPVHPTSEQGEA